MTINPDGTFTVDITDTPAGTVPFDKVVIDIQSPGGVTVEDLTTTACVHPCKFIIFDKNVSVYILCKQSDINEKLHCLSFQTHQPALQFQE